MDLMNVGLAIFPMWPTERPTLGITYVAAALREAGFQVSVFDYNIRLWNQHSLKNQPDDLWLWKSWLNWAETPPFKTEILPQIRSSLDLAVEELSQAISSHKLEAVGFSVFETGLNSTRYVSERLRARFPTLKIFWGGAEIPNGRCLGDLSNGTVDALVFGEGERTAVELLRAWSRRDGSPASPIAGVVLRREKSAQPVLDRAALAMDELPELSFMDYDLATYSTQSLPIMASRGCIAVCAFCSEAPMWGRFRYRSPEKVVSELARVMKETGIRKFYFSDSLLNGNHAHMVRMAELISERGLDLRFEGNSRIDQRLTPEVLRTLRKAGCEALTFGLESGSQRMLVLMRKGVRKEVARKVIKDTAEAGIHANVNIVVGFPGEEEPDFQETLDFLEENRNFIHIVSTGFGMEVGPNMPVTDHPERFDLRLDSQGQPFVDQFGKWCSRDGRNNYQVRMQRVGRLWEWLDRLGISYHPKGVQAVQSCLVVGSGNESYAFKIPVWKK